MKNSEGDQIKFGQSDAITYTFSYLPPNLTLLQHDDEEGLDLNQNEGDEYAPLRKNMNIVQLVRLLNVLDSAEDNLTKEL